MGLRGTLAKRVVQAIVTIFIALAIDFIFFHMLPGDPATFLARNPNIPEAAQEQIIIAFGLDKPLPEQFFLFIVNFLTGNFGISFRYQTDVGVLILHRLLNTLLLILPATIASIAIGIYIGKHSAWKRGERTDAIGLVISLLTYSIPSFFLSMFFIMLFAVNLGWFPITAIIPNIDFVSNPLVFTYEIVRRLILPWGVLTIALIGVFALIMRNALLDVLSEDYMITAKAKGQTEKDQLDKEAVPNAMIPVTTIIALNLGATVAGALQVEVIFSYPGIGRLLWDGILWRDYPVLQGTFFVITVVMIFANLAADFLYYWLDPRIRVGTEFTITDEKKGGFFEWFLRPFTYLATVLLCLDIVILLLAPSYAALFLIGTLAILVFVRRQDILRFIWNRAKLYSPGNLTYLWTNHRPQMLVRLSQLVLTLNVLFVTIVMTVALTMSDAYGLEWVLSWITTFVGASVFPPVSSLDGWLHVLMLSASIIAHPLLTITSLVGWLCGYFLNRQVRTIAMVKQILGNKMGIAGAVTVSAFAGLAIFGDILAPYDPTAHLTGTPRRPPTPLPLDQGALLDVSLAILVIGAMVWVYAGYRNRPSISASIQWAFIGTFLAYVAILFLPHSLARASSVATAGSFLLGGIGLALALPNLRSALREITKSALRPSLERLIGLTMLTLGLALLMTTLLWITTGNPTSFPGFHLLGTDQLGRDVFSQLVIGVRITLIIGLVATMITMFIGGMIGLLAGYYGGIADSLLMRFTDIFFVIPGLVIMIILGAILPPSVYSLIIIIGIFSWPSTARIVRGQVLTIRERDYIERARAVGGSKSYIMFKHILPAVAPLIVANTVLVTAYAILSEVVLDFFGLGDPTMVSWGTMLYQAFGSGAMTGNLWWWVFPPGIMVVLLLMGVSMLGYAMDEIANPRLRRR